jgi:hypothetical protein
MVVPLSQLCQICQRDYKGYGLKIVLGYLMIILNTKRIFRSYNFYREMLGLFFSRGE